MKQSDSANSSVLSMLFILVNRRKSVWNPA